MILLLWPLFREVIWSPIRVVARPSSILDWGSSSFLGVSNTEQSQGVNLYPSLVCRLSRMNTGGFHCTGSVDPSCCSCSAFKIWITLFYDCKVPQINRCMLKGPEGEFLVKKVMSWEGVRREVGLRYLQLCSQPQTKLPPNSLPNINFLTKNSPSDLFAVVRRACLFVSIVVRIRKTHRAITN